MKDGKRVNGTINGFESIHADIVPVLVEMLRKGGFEAAINFGNDAYQNMADGKPGMYMFGHGASVVDPYATMELYHSQLQRAERHDGWRQPLLALQEPRLRQDRRRNARYASGRSRSWWTSS